MKFRIRALSAVRSEADAIRVKPIRIAIRAKPLRVLDFDIENRPLSYLGSDFTTGEITAIAWAWTDDPEHVTACLLGELTIRTMLEQFVSVYNDADLVTGHFIRGHDLPMINGALMECGMAPLGDKMTSDTKLDALRLKGISRSQESLGAMFNLEAPKVQMNQAKWRAANRLTPGGLEEVRQRVIGDVRQHIELRRKLLEGGYLASPVKWRSGVHAPEVYVP